MALKERKTNLRDAEVGNCVKFYFFLELDCTKPIARKKCIIRSIVSNLCLFLGKAIILFTILMNRTCTHILQQIQIKACFSNPARRLFFTSVYIFPNDYQRSWPCGDSYSLAFSLAKNGRYNTFNLSNTETRSAP